jgi:hypothetical protein
MTGCDGFIAFVLPGLISTCCAFPGNNMKPSLVAGRNKTREGFSYAVYQVPLESAEAIFNAS